MLRFNNRRGSVVVGKGKILVILFIMLLFGMAIPSLIVTGVLLLFSVDVSFGLVYGVITIGYMIFSAPFLYKQLRKENYLEVEDDESYYAGVSYGENHEDDTNYKDEDNVGDSECNKYM